MGQDDGRIVVVGSTMVDLVTRTHRMPQVGETLEAQSFTIGCGGKGANQAVAAARLGSSVAMVARVGEDAFADTTVESLARDGIDVRHVHRTPGPSGVAPIFVDDQGRNSILVVKGANDHLSPPDVDAALGDLAGSRLLVCQLEVPLETVYHAVAAAERLRLPVLLNPAPASPDLDLDRIASVEWFVPNETELALLTGMPVETLEQVEQAARVLLARGIRNVVVTLGSRGALWASAAGVVQVETPAVQAVDTTGAGDAFVGCLADGLVHGLAPEQALRRAGRYAADSVTRPGTQTSYADAAQFAAWEAPRG